VTDAAGLAWIVNLGCIELHTWPSRVVDLERPDYLLVDLDPSEGNAWEHVREIALVVRDVMDELELPSFPKTSGATGLHVLVPLRPELPFREVRRFAKALAQEVERRVGDQDVATTTWKVTIGAASSSTTVRTRAIGRSRPRTRSARPRTRARPRRWEAVADVDPAAFTLTSIRERIAVVGDPTAQTWRRPVSLRPRFGRLGLEAPAR
jgi:bifunctional non-homologous end joining protein LigD